MRCTGQCVQLRLQHRQLAQHGGPVALLLGGLGGFGSLTRLGDQRLSLGYAARERREGVADLRRQAVQADHRDGLSLEVERGRSAVEQRGLHLQRARGLWQREAHVTRSGLGGYQTPGPLHPLRLVAHRCRGHVAVGQARGQLHAHAHVLRRAAGLGIAAHGGAQRQSRAGQSRVAA